MKVGKIFDDNHSKLNTKEELLYLLKKNRIILAEHTAEYLNSLIELEFSIIRDYISEDERESLSELEIYKRIAIYNIYYRALNIFNQEDPKLRVFGKDAGWEDLSVYATLGGKMVNLFNFNYKERQNGFNSPIPDGYKTMKIGSISLFQTLENESLRNAELNHVLEHLERLYSEENPNHYLSRHDAVGGPASNWAFEHMRKIEEYEKRFYELDGKTELTEEEKREIELTRKYHDLLLEDYGLTTKSFKDKRNNPFGNLSNEKNELSKTLVKRMPNLVITDNIKYI